MAVEDVQPTDQPAADAPDAFYDEPPEGEPVAAAIPAAESTPAVPDEPDAEVPAEVPDPLPVSVQHPPRLISAALDLGISQQHVDAMPTDALIDIVMRLQDAQRPAEKPAPVQPDAEESDDAILKYLETEAFADPKMVGLLRKKFKRMEELDKVASKIETMEKREAARHQDYVAQSLEAAIANLGPEYEDVLGKGSLQSLPKDSDARKARTLIFRAAGIDINNENPAVAAAKYAEAVKAIYGKRVKAKAPAAPVKPAPKKPLISEDEWSRASLGRPVAVKTEREVSADSAVRKYFAERGMPVGDPKDELNGVPE